MRKAILILAVIISLAFAANYNTVDTYLSITNGTDKLNLFISGDTAYIESSLPLVIKAPNIEDLEERFDVIDKRLDALESVSGTDSIFTIKPYKTN